jgi:Fur family ferric uptake transcriptional regulator
MTLASQTAPAACATLDDAVALLRQRGFRLSTSRRLVLEALFATDQPVTAEQIATRLRLDLTSVYRNLEVLEQQGLVRHVHLGHGPGLYALVARGEREYLYCERCHAVTAVAPEELTAVRDQIRRRFGYEVRFTHFPLTGTCAACAVSPPSPPSAPR